MLGNTTSVILLALIVALYMLPSLIAFSRDHPHRRVLMLLNILLGWTLIGWIMIFVWAVAADADATEIP